MTRAATGKSFRQTRSVRQIHVEVKKIKAVTFAKVIQINFGQPVVFGKNFRQIFFGQSKRRIFQDNRFDGENFKSGIKHTQHIFREVEIFIRVSAAHIIIVAVPTFDEIFKIFQDAGITAAPGNIRSHRVMNFFAPVQTQHEGNIIFVQPLNFFVVKQNSVRRQSEFENFSGFPFALPDVLCDKFYRVEIQKRFAAEKINFAMLAFTGMFDDKINRRPADFAGHQRTPTAVTAAVAETIFTTQIAILRNHETQTFHNTGRGENRRNIIFRREKFPRVDELPEFVKCLVNFGGRIFFGKFFFDFGIVFAGENVEQIENHFVNEVNRAAFHVVQNKIFALFEFMNHLAIFPISQFLFCDFPARNRSACVPPP